MTITQTRPVSLEEQAAAFDCKVRDVLGITSDEPLEDLDDGGTIYRVITFPKCGRLLIKLNQFGDALELIAQRTSSYKELHRALYHARTVFGAQASYPLGSEHFASFRVGPEGNYSTVSLQELMDKLHSFLPAKFEASFAFISYQPKVKALHADAGFSYSSVFKGYILV